MPPSSEQPIPPVQPLPSSKKVWWILGAVLAVLLVCAAGGWALLIRSVDTNQMPSTTGESSTASTTTQNTSAIPAQNVSQQWIHVDIGTSTTFVDGEFNPLTVDPSTYEIFATSSESVGYCFSKDKNNVYYNLGDGSAESIGADVSSFVSLDVLNPQSDDYGYCYGKDKSNAYSYFGGAGPAGGGGILAGVDPNTFTTDATIYPFAKDATHVFLADKLVTGADPNTFAVIPDSGLAKDKNHIYTYGYQVIDNFSVLPGADPATFSYDAQTDVARDSTHVWYGGDLGGSPMTIIQGVDPKTFEAINFVYYKDVNHIYYGYVNGESGGIEPIAADLTSFEAYYPIFWNSPELGAGYRFVVGYAHDKNSAYYDGQVIPGADVATFVPVPSQCANDSSCTFDAQDKNHQYLEGQVVQ